MTLLATLLIDPTGEVSHLQSVRGEVELDGSVERPEQAVISDIAKEDEATGPKQVGGADENVAEIPGIREILGHGDDQDGIE